MQELNFIHFPKTRDIRKRESKFDVLICKGYVLIKEKYFEIFKGKYCSVSMTADKKYLKLTPTENQSEWACTRDNYSTRVGSVKLMQKLGCCHC